MQRQLAFLVLLVLALPHMGLGLEANLAELDPGATRTLGISPGIPLTVSVVNQAPKSTYSGSLVIRNVEVAELPDVVSSLSGNLTRACPAIQQLAAATSEDDVPELIAEVREGIANTSCDKKEGESIIRDTVEVFPDTYKLQRGQELVLTVKRHADPSEDVKKAVWTFVWTTGARGEWNASYGFAYFQENDEEFFTRSGEEEGTFVIHREADRGDDVLAPAVFFTWAREFKKLEDWDHGVVGGLGFDLSKPVLFGGYQWTYNQNLTFTLGLVARPETNLDGKYEVGQVLKEDLDADQLTDDSSYGAAPFVGLSFRFGKNPFAKKDGGD